MSAFRIDFEWLRDQAGYRLLTAEQPQPQSQPVNALAAAARGEVTLSGLTFSESLWRGSWFAGVNLKPQRVVRCGGTLISYRPLAEFGALYRQFMKATDPAGVLAFIEKFGPLTRGGLDKEQGDNVSEIIENAQIMRDVLDTYSHGDRSALVRMMGPSGIGMGKTEIARIEAALIVDPVTSAPRLQLTVKDLLTALWLQFGQAIANGATIRECHQCGVLFEAGPGTGRRLDAKFCSDDHRVTFHSLKRSQRSPAHA